MSDPTQPTSTDPLPVAAGAWSRPPFALSVAIAVVMVVAVSYLRLAVALDRVLPVAYGVPLVFCIWFRSRPILWWMVAAFTAVTFIKYGYVLHAGNPALVGGRWISWAMVEGDLLLIALIVHYGVGARDAIEERGRRLETLNRSLTDRETEVARQNEELRRQAEESQAQSEELNAQAMELERATEELRVTNQELEDRERLLERLLELSQSLTADLSREQVMSRICDAVDAVLGVPGAVAAALEEVDGGAVFRIAAAWGLEPSDDRIPAPSSFAALVLERGQTGFIQDLAQRPDLQVPRPRFGPPLRSILAAPLRFEGGRRGTIEIYTREPHAWTRQQIVMLEALSHQASTSLANVRLVDEIDRQRRWLETVIGTLPVGVMVCDAQGGNVRLNAAAAATHRAAPEVDFAEDQRRGALTWRLERDGRPLPLEDSPMIRAARFGEQTTSAEIDLVFDDGSRISELVAAAPIRDRAGAIVGAVATLVDITQLKALQRELEQRRADAEEASVRKTRFLAAVSHDIRTPANAINLLAELMSRAAQSPSPDFINEATQLARELQSAARSLVHLVSDVLDVTRYDYGKIDLQVSTFPLAAFLEDQLRQHRPTAAAKGLDLRVEPPAGVKLDGIRLHTDAIKLARALNNLLGNAIKFTEHGGVSLRAAPTPGGGVTLAVADSGVGIATEHLPRIFDEFFQVKNPARDRNKGTGLGLAICKRLVEAMGGSLDVQSEPACGSTFTITLPPSSVAAAVTAPGNADSASAPQSAARPRRLQGTRILLVEDHDLTRLAIARILQREGAQVREAADGSSARDALADGAPFDALLLDMMLPDLDGREILGDLGARRPPGLQTVVVLTGDVTPERTAEVHRLGADLLMHKPVDPHAIVEYLRSRFVKA